MLLNRFEEVPRVRLAVSFNEHDELPHIMGSRLVLHWFEPAIQACSTKRGSKCLQWPTDDCQIGTLGPTANHSPPITYFVG